MSSPSLDLERPDTGRQAWSMSGSPATVDNYDRDVQGKGCWSSFSRCVGGMWATRQMTKGDDREIFVRTTLRELIVYFIFLVIMCILTFGMTSTTMFYYTKVMSDLFLDAPYPDTKNTFRGSTQVMDFWRFAENILMDGLFWEYWYDVAKSPTTFTQDNNILYENKLLGVARMRQLQVRNDSCTTPDSFAKAIRRCYNEYSESAENKGPFGIGNETAFIYQSEKQLNGLSHAGKLTTYGGGGFVQNLAADRSTSEDVISHLRENLWITRGTRAVFVDFTVYNANINLFCVIKLLFEFPATGGIIPSWSFRTVKLLRYVTPWDYFVMACEYIFTFFILYYIVEESLEIKSLRCAYFKNMWNILDLLVIGLSLVCIFFNIYLQFTVEGLLEELLSKPEDFADFEFLGYWQTEFNNIVAVCVFFAWFKLFKYISFNKTMTQLSSTLSRCAKDVAGFAIMFFIVFFAFAQLGYLLFGTQVKDFSNFISAIFTLLRTILGDFNFQEIQEAHRVLGPIFFLSYVFFVFFVLLNMFLAIINDTYSEVKAEIANQRNEFEIGDYFQRGYNNVMGKLGKRDKLIDLQNELKLSDDSVITLDTLRTSLKKCNFADAEIEMFFEKYDTDKDEELSQEEVRRIVKDLEGNKIDFDRDNRNDVSSNRPNSAKDVGEVCSRPASSSGHGTSSSVSFEEFSVVQRRVDRLDHCIGSIVSKIDAVLVKLDTMEKTKHKRRETMSKILDTITENDSMDDKTKRKQMEKLVRNELDKWEGEPGTPNGNKTQIQ